MASLNIAFAAPEAPKGYGPSASKPIDLVHLARQTMGDRTVEVEVLRIFARQARQALADFAVADQQGKIATAHRLKGAAQAVGAFPLSQFAEEIESGAVDSAHMAKMTAAITEAENFINKLCR
jgi:HPt (histidine-containing phosphotransfer) domain-containing protein